MDGVRVSCPKCKVRFIVWPDGRSAPIDVTQSPAAVGEPRHSTTHVEKSDVSAAAPPAETPSVPPSASQPAPTAEEAQWRLDVQEYSEYTFTLAELKKLVRDGGFYRTDRVTRVGGDEVWVEAGTVPEFTRLFQLKEMLDKKKEAGTSAVGAPPPSQYPCANHPQWEAGYRCRKCGRYLCTHCVEPKKAGGSDYMVCPTCQDLCMKVDKSLTIPPFYTSLPMFFSAPFKGWGPLMVLINAVLLYLSSSFIIGMTGLKWAFKLIVLAYLLWIVKHAARGRETLPDWPDTSDWIDLMKIGGRSSTVTAVCFAPLLIFFLIFYETNGLTSLGFGSTPAEPSAEMMQAPEMTPIQIPQGDEGVGAPDTTFVEQLAVQRGGGSKEDMSLDARAQLEKRLAAQKEAEEKAAEAAASQMSGFFEKGIVFLVGAIICCTFAFVYYPMCLGVTAVWDVLIPILNPFFIFRLIGRVLKEYIIFLLLFAVLLVMGFLPTLPLALIPIVGAMIASLISCYFYCVSSFMLGRFCYANDRALGWEEEIYPNR